MATKIKSLRLLAPLLILPIARAQDTVFSEGFDLVQFTLGFGGMNFLIGFGLIFTTILLAAERIFRTPNQRTAFNKSSVVLGVVIGLAGAFYIYLNKIDAITLLGSYGILMAIILLILLFLRLIDHNRSGRCGFLINAGVFLLILGSAIPNTIPSLENRASLLISLGIISLILALIFCVAWRGDRTGGTGTGGTGTGGTGGGTGTGGTGTGGTGGGGGTGTGSTPLTIIPHHAIALLTRPPTSHLVNNVAVYGGTKPYRYRWELIGSPGGAGAATLDAHTVNHRFCRFSPDTLGVYKFKLTVADASGTTVSNDRIFITVERRGGASRSRRLAPKMPSAKIPSPSTFLRNRLVEGPNAFPNRMIGYRHSLQNIVDDLHLLGDTRSPSHYTWLNRVDTNCMPIFTNPRYQASMTDIKTRLMRNGVDPRNVKEIDRFLNGPTVHNWYYGLPARNPNHAGAAADSQECDRLLRIIWHRYRNFTLGARELLKALYG